MGAVYDDCPECRNWDHDHCSAGNKMICTCNICNAVAICDKIDIVDTNKEALLSNFKYLSLFIESMDEDEYKLFQKMVGRLE